MAPRTSAFFWYPAVMIVSAMGCAWALWRTALYLVDPVALPFISCWTLFAVWIAVAGWYVAPARQG